ncbi:MAG: hypothetical protein EXR50_06445 [Dehalococcoidia bacterium]|nr:hypothetical protein [Dehalococcoidia bacterium]
MNDSLSSRAGDAEAEVIQATTISFTAHCYELNGAPPLGSLVKAVSGSTEVIAAVSLAQTSSVDSGRKPVALGDGRQTFEEIIHRNPHLSQLFTTEFQAVVVGYKERDEYVRRLPPAPSPVHSPVYRCADREIADFTSSLSFLDLIYAASLPPLREEMLAAFIRMAGQARGGDRNFLAEAGRQAVVLMRKEPAQLWRLLEMIRA